jgi:1,4-alpha-glucan branching enzyme
MGHKSGDEQLVMGMKTIPKILRMKTPDKGSRPQTFRFTAPAARSVMLVGDFTQWQRQAIPMQRQDDGVWLATVDLQPGMHMYRFLVDGEWRDDPECTVRVGNPFGGQDMVREAA